MKKLLLTIALAAMATFVNAQGTIQFGPNNPVTRFRVNGALPVAGQFAPGALSFGVYIGSTAGDLGLGSSTLGTNSATAGLLNAPGGNNFQVSRQGVNTEAGQTVFVQIRGWETRAGGYDQARAGGGLFGETAVLPFVLGPASGPGTVVWASSATDLTKFQGINFVPEPSTIALAVLGLGSLLLFRRRK